MITLEGPASSSFFTVLLHYTKNSHSTCTRCGFSTANLVIAASSLSGVLGYSRTIQVSLFSLQSTMCTSGPMNSDSSRDSTLGKFISRFGRPSLQRTILNARGLRRFERPEPMLRRRTLSKRRSGRTAVAEVYGSPSCSLARSTTASSARRPYLREAVVRQMIRR